MTVGVAALIVVVILMLLNADNGSSVTVSVVSRLNGESDKLVLTIVEIEDDVYCWPTPNLATMDASTWTFPAIDDGWLGAPSTQHRTVFRQVGVRGCELRLPRGNYLARVAAPGQIGGQYFGCDGQVPVSVAVELYADAPLSVVVGDQQLRGVSGVPVALIAIAADGSETLISTRRTSIEGRAVYEHAGAVVARYASSRNVDPADSAIRLVVRLLSALGERVEVKVPADMSRWQELKMSVGELVEAEVRFANADGTDLSGDVDLIVVGADDALAMYAESLDGRMSAVSSSTRLRGCSKSLLLDAHLEKVSALIRRNCVSDPKAVLLCQRKSPARGTDEAWVGMVSGPSFVVEVCDSFGKSLVYKSVFVKLFQTAPLSHQVGQCDPVWKLVRSGIVSSDELGRVWIDLDVRSWGSESKIGVTIADRTFQESLSGIAIVDTWPAGGSNVLHASVRLAHPSQVLEGSTAGLGFEDPGGVRVQALLGEVEISSAQAEDDGRFSLVVEDTMLDAIHVRLLGGAGKSVTREVPMRGVGFRKIVFD
ncbi:MAG: hypothetical protein IT454_20000 [Planctomycetes bacterium]|nr:hypothetical protein [Planctomycetota bacterium]